MRTAEPAATKAPLTRRARLVKTIKSWVWSFALAFAILMPLRSAVADWNDVPTGSMEPTIMPGERIFVNKLAYGLRVPFTYTWITEWSAPLAGEIVVFYSPKDGTRLVKRIVAVPGDVVELRQNRLFVNGVECHYRALSEGQMRDVRSSRAAGWGDSRFALEQLGGRSHAMMQQPARPAQRTFGPVTVPAGKYFMMGDNRDNSADSRYFGFVPRERIVGRSSVVVLSFEPDNNYIPRWARWFRALK